MSETILCVFARHFQKVAATRQEKFTAFLTQLFPQFFKVNKWSKNEANFSNCCFVVVAAIGVFSSSHESYQYYSEFLLTFPNTNLFIRAELESIIFCYCFDFCCACQLFIGRLEKNYFAVYILFFRLFLHCCKNNIFFQSFFVNFKLFSTNIKWMLYFLKGQQVRLSQGWSVLE